MRQTGMWFFLSCKRYLRRFSFVLILLCLPAGAWWMGKLEKSGDSRIRIAVCVESGSGDALAESLVQGLTEKSRDSGEEMFLFYRCESEEQVKEQVASRKAECGYVVAADLGKRMEEESYKRSIRIFSAPSTTTAELSTEVVFAELASVYNREILENYVEKGRGFSFAGEAGGKQREQLALQAGQYYDIWLENGGIFQFEYETLNSIAGMQNDVSDGRDGMEGVFPVRGIAAVYVFITGIYGAVIGAEDERRNLYVWADRRKKGLWRLTAQAAPVILAAASALAAIALGGESGSGLSGFAAEAGIMAVYGIAVVLFARLMGLVWKKPEILCCLIPFFLMGSLIFCPVLADISRYFPAAGQLGRLFLPWYYLHCF